SLIAGQFAFLEETSISHCVLVPDHTGDWLFQFGRIPVSSGPEYRSVLLYRPSPTHLPRTHRAHYRLGFLRRGNGAAFAPSWNPGVETGSVIGHICRSERSVGDYRVFVRSPAPLRVLSLCGDG